MDDLTAADREALHNRAHSDGREIEDVVLELIRAGLHGSVHNVNTGHVSGPSIQTGRIDGDISF
ncbi:hypothetical protein GCM10027271_18510 [Saccharopolyspora gloriosae]